MVMIFAPLSQENRLELCCFSPFSMCLKNWPSPVKLFYEESEFDEMMKY